ncbi:MAG: DUF1402 family protein [Bauldia sp.]|nr:MAG: DUF1402 family protein [Bauldia sp.]
MKRFRPIAAVIGAFLAIAVAAPAVAVAADVVVVPPGNRSKQQPKIYAGSKFLTAIRGSGTYSDKYKKVYSLLARDKKLMANIKKVSALYGIDPIHVIGGIVGEHTYNIDTFDTLQTYYVKALQYADNQSLAFSYKGQTAAQLFARPQFAQCQQYKTNYEVWDCRQTIWNRQFMGRMVDGKLYFRDRLHRVFFKPAFGGQTFGIGQLGPVAALMVTDIVHAKSGLPLLSIDDAGEVYEQIMNPDTALHYIAANVRVSIDLYKRIAGFDISQNPGVTATLYNLGDAATRARELKTANDARIKKGQPAQYPQENFYGWLINDREAELRKLL